MFLNSEFQRKIVGQCQQKAGQQQEQIYDLEKYDDRLAKSLLRKRTQISNMLFYFSDLRIIIGGM
jgi:predicted RecB family nuclease